MTKRDIQATFVAALVVLCCSTAPAAANVNMTSVCLLVSPGTLVGNPNDCTSYYSCAGSVATLQSCASGLNFDKNQGSCVSGWVAGCSSTADSAPCDGQPIGTWQASGSCGDYYYCGSTGPLIGSCPVGQNFNPSSQRCVYASEYSCPNQGGPDTGDVDSFDLCSIIPNNMYFGNPDACSSWYFCSAGILKHGDCPSGYYFDVRQQMCDYVSTCSQVTNDPNLPGISLAGTPCTAVGSLTQASSCNQYYVCSASLIYQLETCQLGYSYDTKSGKCLSSLQAVNTCNRCAGTTSTFVNACVVGDCSQYLACSDGEEQYQQACPKDYYFDESLGGCTSTNPNYQCCSGGTTAAPVTTATVSTVPVTQSTVTTAPSVKGST